MGHDIIEGEKIHGTKSSYTVPLKWLLCVSGLWPELPRGPTARHPGDTQEGVRAEDHQAQGWERGGHQVQFLSYHIPVIEPTHPSYWANTSQLLSQHIPVIEPTRPSYWANTSQLLSQHIPTIEPPILPSNQHPIIIIEPTNPNNWATTSADWANRSKQLIHQFPTTVPPDPNYWVFINPPNWAAGSQ
jgi:hypothetical protein